MGLVSWLIAIPFLTALVVGLTPSGREHWIRWIALGGMGLVSVVTAVVTYQYWMLAVAGGGSPGEALHSTLYLVERVAWFESLGIQYYVGVDGISVAMIIMTALIILTGVLASWNVTHRPKEFFALLLVLVAGVFGVFVSFDLFLFFLFYELAVLPMYLLIGVWGTGRKEYAAMKLTLMLMAGSALILVGILALYHASGLQTFDIMALSTVQYSSSFQSWVFPIVFIGFGVLGALYPFHTWSPDGHASAPTAVSMLHAGVLMKLGGYGALRIGIYLMPEGAKQWGFFFLALATVNIIYGALGAIRQKDLKYFTAYSSVSHCGFVFFGLAALSLMGMKGAVLQMFSHGIMTGLFFALIGMVYARTHTRMLNEMGGLAAVMPWFAALFFLGGLASLGLPGLAGFVAETHVFLAGFFGNPWSDPTAMRVLTVLATMSIVVTAVYVLRGLGRVFLGPLDKPAFRKLTDATLTEQWSTGILAAVLVFVGLMPWFLIDLIEGSILPFVNRLHAAGGLALLQ
jgi:NADH-quinone oxidoreductase subunit M